MMLYAPSAEALETGGDPNHCLIPAFRCPGPLLGTFYDRRSQEYISVLRNQILGS